MVSGANMQSDKFELALSGGLTMMMILGELGDPNMGGLGFFEKSLVIEDLDRWDLGLIKRRWLCLERFVCRRSLAELQCGNGDIVLSLLLFLPLPSKHIARGRDDEYGHTSKLHSLITILALRYVLFL